MCRPRTAAALSAAAALALAAGCGERQRGETPAACLAGPGAYLEALEAAPGPVRLDGGTPISDCLVGGQSAGQLATAGDSMVRAATRLNGEARAEPDGHAPLRLGYLVGAAGRGAEATEGIHTDLLRRLGAAALYSPGDGQLPRPLREGYRRGREAGRQRG